MLTKFTTCDELRILRRRLLPCFSQAFATASLHISTQIQIFSIVAIKNLNIQHN